AGTTRAPPRLPPLTGSRKETTTATGKKVNKPPLPAARFLFRPPPLSRPFEPDYRLPSAASLASLIGRRLPSISAQLCAAWSGRRGAGYVCRSVLETFLFAVLLSTFTTLQCLCMLGPNIQAWIRVFSKNGAMSIWDNSLQITTMCSIVGAWLGAFPIPLDWDRPWQIWPISCSLGATFGYVAGLIIAPLWIYWNRKKLTYKSR
uniref:Phosphatidylinositol glycan anchor biosynthesis class F n=1 Tax=Pelusios castaneus TaxID=367368 RepID=A0A8C8RXZ9_9SAUR